MENLIKFFGLIIAVWFVTTAAEPIQNIKYYFGLSNDSKIKNKVQDFFVKLLNCSLCLGTYVGLIAYQNVYKALIFGLAAETFARTISFVFKKLGH